MGLFVTASEILFSADTGRSLKILFRFTNLHVVAGYPKSGSIVIAWEQIAIHPRVSANRAVIGLGCSLKKKTDH